MDILKRATLLTVFSFFPVTIALAKMNQINEDGLKCELGVPAEHEKKVDASYYSRERHMEFCGRLAATLQIFRVSPRTYNSIRFIGAFMRDPDSNKVVLIARTNAPDSPIQVFQPQDWRNKAQVSEILGKAAIYLASLVRDSSAKESLEKPVGITSGDKAMEMAIAHARSGLNAFLQKVDAKDKSIKDPAVKVKVSEGSRNEYFWVSSFTREGSSFRGTIREKGESISFLQDQIVDWDYFSSKGDRIYGNATACALLDKLSPNEKAYFKGLQLDCGFLN